MWGRITGRIATIETRRRQFLQTAAKRRTSRRTRKETRSGSRRWRSLAGHGPDARFDRAAACRPTVTCAPGSPGLTLAPRFPTFKVSLAPAAAPADHVHNSAGALSVRGDRPVRMTPVAASVAAPHVIDGRLRLLMLYLERRDQGVLCRHSHGSPLALDVNPNCEFERHVLIPSISIFASRTRVDAWF